MKREQIADIAAKFYPLPIKSGRDIIKMDDWCDKLADEIMALPIDVPSDEEMNNQSNMYGLLAIEDHLPDYGVEENASLDFIRGANWMRNEIIKRNVR